MTAIAGTRLIDLAKELKMTPAELVTSLKDLGVNTSGATSLIDTETANTVRSLLGGGASGGKVAEVSPDANVKELATAMGIAANEAQGKLMKMGHLVSITQRLPQNVAEQLASSYGFTLKLKKPEPKPVATNGASGPKHKAPAGSLQPRPPVVTIMGHVDHGKTTLLDAIRKTNVVEGEFGGITQHIGAYQVEIEHNGEKRKITFLDTPGHAAFTEMRARGASVTDIVILVVAADDGIMPQTAEAIKHAQDAKVPMIVAINKIDRPEANPDRIKQQLTEHNVVVEDYGGDTPALPVSAKTREGLNDLLEYVLLVADVQELKADPSGHATGAVVEAKVETGRGPVATVLVQSGTLRVGDSLVAGLGYGKVRSMINDRGERLQKAGPATPVEVSGLNVAPSAGDIVEVVKNDKEARNVAERRGEKQRRTRFDGQIKRITLDDLSKAASALPRKNLNVIVRADVQGSLEAVIGQLDKIEANKIDPEVVLSVKTSGVGSITEADVDMAVATDSMIIGFNVQADPSAKRVAERYGVDVRTYNIIYNLVEDIDLAMKKKLTPIFEESPLGKAEVRQSFRTPKGIVIAGSYVTEGKIQRNALIRVRRGKAVLTESKVDTLRHIKDDVREMAAGYECGIVIADWTDVQVGDILECYEMREIPRY